VKKHCIALLVTTAVFLIGCAGQKTLVQQKPHEPDPKAIELFMDGVLYDQDQNFAAGLLSYHEAALYDTTSPTLYLAIGRDYLLMGREESALVNLEKCIRKDPRNLEARSLAARVYLNQGRWNRAEKAYAEIVALDSTDTDALYNLALIHLRKSENEKTAAMLKKILAASPEPDTRTMNQLARLYMDMKKYDDALAMYRQMVEFNPRNGFGYFGVGTVLEVKRDTAGASAQYIQALAFSPELGEAREHLGEIYLVRKEYDKAVRLFREAVENDSTDIGSLLALAGVHEAKGDSAGAETLFKDARRRFPKDAQPVLDLGNFYMNRQRFGLAYREFQKAVQLAPQNFFGWLFSGVSLVQMDSLGQSLPKLERALSMVPGDPMANYYMGSVLGQLRRSRESIPYLQNALRSRPKWIAAMSAIAGSYENMKEYALADSCYGAALQIEPDNALLLNNWSYGLSERNERLGDALRMAQKALEKEPNNGAYLDTMGWIYYKMGEYDKAKELIERAFLNRKTSPDILDHLGDVYDKIGNREKAADFWKKALELDPSNAAIKNKLNRTTGELR